MGRPMKDLKDWSTSITGLKELDGEEVINLYSEMLATAHDIKYKVPDEQLIETEDPEKLRSVIPPLHEGLVAFHASAVADANEKAKAAAKAPKAVKKPKAEPTNPARKAAKKAAPKETEKMATAKKEAVAKPAAKKAAKAAKPAKKAAKKAAKDNARTGVARNPFSDTAVIKVLNKETGVRADSERGKRIAVVFKYNGKKVADFFAKEKPPYNRTDTLRFMIDRKFITVK